MSCVSVHDTCIYLLAHSFCCTSSFCVCTSTHNPKRQCPAALTVASLTSRIQVLFIFFPPNWARSAWYTWQMLHPSEPSHLHSLLSKFWPSACDKKWQLKSLEGFVFAVFCTVRLTCSCLSKLWPSNAVSLWEGSRTHNATGARPMYLTLWNVRATETSAKGQRVNFGLWSSHVSEVDSEDCEPTTRWGLDSVLGLRASRTPQASLNFDLQRPVKWGHNLLHRWYRASGKGIYCQVLLSHLEC